MWDIIAAIKSPLDNGLVNNAVEKYDLRAKLYCFFAGEALFFLMMLYAE